MSNYRMNRMRQRVSRAYWRGRCAELEQKQAHTSAVAVAALRKVEELQARCDELQRKLDRASSYDEDVVIPETEKLRERCEKLERVRCYINSASHRDGCATEWGLKCPCTCGLAAALAALEG